jgi:dipeptidyl aminopeptidase/acylaminoacyl peptidase
VAPRFRALALVLDTAQTPGDVYVLDRKSNAVARWTESKVEGTRCQPFPHAAAIGWTSFDGREITGFITMPPRASPGADRSLSTSTAGPRRRHAGFQGRWNYYVNELGIALIEPNVRGSSGYGRRSYRSTME